MQVRVTLLNPSISRFPNCLEVLAVELGSLGDRLVAYRLLVILVLHIFVSDLFISSRIDAFELCEVFGVSAIGSSEEIQLKIDLSQLIIDVPGIILAKAWGQGYAKSYFSRNA